MPTTVAVIGAGPLGLMAVKNLTQDGFEVTAFEKRSYVGGLWKPSQDSAISITDNTRFNSSRFISAISDFPYPEHHDDFPTGPQVYEYMNLYADHFNLRPHIKLNTAVLSLRRIDQKWELKTATQGADPEVSYFDKVLTCTGSFVTPRIPKITDLEKFKGQTLHSVDFPDPSNFKDQNVLVVGLHATAQDIVCQLSKAASKVYISKRTGVVIMQRFNEDGRTFDQMMTLNFFTKLFMFMNTWLPTLWYRFVDSLFVKMSKAAFPYQPKEWGLSPAPSIAVSTPVVADELYPLMKSGFATPVPEIRCVTGSKQVTLKDGRVLDDIDTIVYCTGYFFDIPKFVPTEFHPYPNADQEPYLYRNIFPLHPDPNIRNSLAFTGQVGFAFPGFVQFEFYTLAVSQIWQGKKKLPPLQEMKQWYEDKIAEDDMLLKKYGHQRYTAFIRVEDMFPWVMETAGVGLVEHTSWFSWRAWKFWWSDPKFYKLMTTGLFTPTIWRLFDMGGRKAWPGAKQQIIRDNEVADIRAKEREQVLKKEKEAKKTA